jgi:4-phytase/acid phosphatase
MFVLALCAITGNVCSAQPLDAAEAPAAADRIQRAVLLMRHGVRSAMSTPAELERYSDRPWPAFSVPPGHLTQKGAHLVEILGRYYGSHYRELGLLEEENCSAVYLLANRTQRTEATARALAEGLLPKCKLDVHTIARGFDPLFDAPAAGVGSPDYLKVQAALLGRMGVDAVAWSASQRAALNVLDALLLRCSHIPCPGNAGRGKRRLHDTPSAVGIGDSERLVSLSAPAAAASGITESLLMSYAEGHSFADLSWSGIDEQALTDVFALHTAEFELRARTRYVAQVTSSHLATRLLATLRVGAGLSARHDPIGEQQQIIAIAGHDGTLVQLGGLLGIDWIIQGYQPNQAVPGGALVFEIWKRGRDGASVLRLRYVAQSLQQLREGRALTRNAPPLSAPIFIPECSEAVGTFDCSLERFTQVLERVIDPAFVREPTHTDEYITSHGKDQT